MRCVRLFTAFALASLAAHGATTAASENSGQPACQRVPLATHPKSISSATYVPALRKILVVDPVMNRLLLFGEDGAATPLADPAVAARAKLPALVAATSQGFVLKLVNSEILTFDNELHLQGEARSLASGNVDPTLGAVVQWTVAGDSIVAYGSVRSPSFPKRSEVGFLRTPLVGDGRAEMVLPFPQSNYYLLGYQYLATVGQTAYFLGMGEKVLPVLYAGDATRRRASRPPPAEAPDTVQRAGRRAGSLRGARASLDPVRPLRRAGRLPLSFDPPARQGGRQDRLVVL